MSWPGSALERSTLLFIARLGETHVVWVRTWSDFVLSPCDVAVRLATKVTPPAVLLGCGVTFTVHAALAPEAMSGVVYPPDVTAAVRSTPFSSRYCTANADVGAVPVITSRSGLVPSFS